MQVRLAAATTATTDYAREVRARAALKQALEARQAAVSEDAARARSSPRFEASETRKQQARSRLQQVREWLKIVRKLFAQDPKGMARALAQAFKDLKAAVKAFKDAGGQDMGAAGDVVGAALTAGRARTGEAREAPERTQGDGGGEADRDGGGDAGADPGSPASAAAGQGAADLAATEGRSFYDAVVSEVRKSIGEDGLAFLKEVRGMVEEIGKLLETARGQAAIRGRDRDTDKAFEEADETLKALHEAMDDMEAGIRRDAPTAGMRLSIAA